MPFCEICGKNAKVKSPQAAWQKGWRAFCAESFTRRRSLVRVQQSPPTKKTAYGGLFIWWARLAPRRPKQRPRGERKNPYKILTTLRGFATLYYHKALSLIAEERNGL